VEISTISIAATMVEVEQVAGMFVRYNQKRQKKPILSMVLAEGVSGQ